ncbi:MAG TPA: hypothetical protein HPP77_06825 [Candidatus Hydrogenedentes bacterium]|nr:hypothetical protein [Candidatus Hydrogenedentota bacterium]
MVKTRNVRYAIIAFALCLAAQGAFEDDAALTIYNQDFAVVRDTIALDLQPGTNKVRYNEITAHAEPDSVILRDPDGVQPLQIVEQNYRADPVSQNLLLSLYEGETIEFEVLRGDKTEIVRGKIVRSGYEPHQAGLHRYGYQYRQTQMAYARGGAGQPVIEVDGKLRFSLPGTPVFPALADDAILKPTFHWLLETDRAGALDAELSYVTGGMSWEAAYNLVSPEDGDLLDIVGWVTLDNQSGKTFEDARIKLVAGDVSKLVSEDERRQREAAARYSIADINGPMPPTVTEKAFDEYHLYTLERRTTLRDRETKQVEFIRASNVQSERFYVYDGVKIDDNRYRGWSASNIREDHNYGTISNPKVWVMREFENSEKNGLGIPLPKGRLRFYRRDTDGQLEFTGENLIDHTPRDETARVYTGNAFDLVGERVRTDFKIDHGAQWINESFKITVRNRKDEPVEIRVVEHLYRWFTWTIPEASQDYEKTDSQTIEFRVQLDPDEEKTVTYMAHYTW